MTVRMNVRNFCAIKIDAVEVQKDAEYKWTCAP